MEPAWRIDTHKNLLLGGSIYLGIAILIALAQVVKKGVLAWAVRRCGLTNNRASNEKTRKISLCLLVKYETSRVLKELLRAELSWFHSFWVAPAISTHHPNKPFLPVLEDFSDTSPRLTPVLACQHHFNFGYE